MTSSSIASPVRWRVVGESVRGASHDAGKLPNQDAIAWDSSDDAAIAVAVSDGHGSPKCFRSASGSAFAVEIALDLLTRFGREAGAQVPAFGRADRDALARALSEAWNRRVADDLRAHPFTKEDERYVEAAAGAGEFAAIAADPLLAYGATLVAVLITPAFVLYAQIGDGDILRVDESGTTRRLFEKDAALAVNETYSLCQLDAWREFRFELVPLAESAPALIILTTDGYVNSFATDAGFLQVGRDLREMIRKDGLDAIARGLPQILTDASTVGSRDDVTVAIVKRVEPGEQSAQPALQRRTVATPEMTPQPPSPSFAGEPPRDRPTRRSTVSKRRRPSPWPLIQIVAIALIAAAGAAIYVAIRDRGRTAAVPAVVVPPQATVTVTFAGPSADVGEWRLRAYKLQLAGKWNEATIAGAQAVAHDAAMKAGVRDVVRAQDVAALGLSQLYAGRRDAAVFDARLARRLDPGNALAASILAAQHSNATQDELVNDPSLQPVAPATAPPAAPAL